MTSPSADTMEQQMTLSDERLREIAAYQPLEFRISGSELISMARELLSRRASPHGEAGVEPVAWPETLTGDALSLAMDAYELIGGLDGAVKSAEDHVQIIWQAIRSALSASPGSSAGESIDRHAYRVAHIDPPAAPPQREGLEEAIRRAEPFITCNSGDGNYSVNFKCRSLKDAQDLHTAVIRALTGKGGE